jgi:Mg2+ and Co2+ transporter CorA
MRLIWLFIKSYYMAMITLTMQQAFNSVAQYNSRIAVRISEANQVDSAAMKTISVLGLVFLPGTFVCVRRLSFSISS